MLVCIAVMNTLKNTKIKEVHLDAVEDMRRFVKQGGSLPDDD
jgi:hypothetical protein